LLAYQHGAIEPQSLQLAVSMLSVLILVGAIPLHVPLSARN
jgi:hypothetical protein